MASPKFLLLCLVSAVTAFPTSLDVRSSQHQPSSPSHTPWDAGATTQFPIHSSCNATERRQIEQGLNETVELAAHAKAHILRWGNESDIYQKYFGNRPSLEPVGAFDLVANGDRGVLFRCDNPDDKCQLEGWAGHWREEKALNETVICELSYRTRRNLITMCALGYNVAESEVHVFWASDLLHRLLHMPDFSQHRISHYADDYEDVIELAKSNSTHPTHDSETLQYFALEAYAYDIAVPGVGCPGPQHDHDHAKTSSTSSTSTAAQPSSTTSEVPKNCHTHAGGVLHCE